MPGDWERVKQIFEEAHELLATERAAFIARACGGDERLRDEVEGLLRNADTDFLADPAVRLGVEESDYGIGAGARIGQYRVIREIGSGGMGSVYLAARADDVYSKQVAIKVVRSGMDSAFMVQRFRNERQILAALEHPNIARLLDGGATEDGSPYLVMEYVEGEPIDAFCKRRSLSVNERINLFLGVCGAVQHAHGQLVVHRDLKPGNILVTTDGTPKLLDFGIAKLLTREGARPVEATSAWMRLMTPEYASPEQVRGEAITTATDVYALGVILYWLLTGRRPYRTEPRTGAEIERAVCQDEPLAPSAAVEDKRLRKRLAGDLDAILLTALRKEPERRYSSVEQFADDLRRHLEHLPVRAHRDALSYRAMKFVRRNTAASVAAVLFVLSLTGGLAGTAWQAHIAERRFNDVRELASSFLFEFHDAVQSLPGSTHVRELMVRRALEYLDRLSRDSAGEAGLQRELAAAYEKVGDVQGNPSRANLGDTSGSLRSHRRALAIREALASRVPSDFEALRELSTSHDRIGDLLWFQGDRAGALEEYRAGLSIRESLWQAEQSAPNGHNLSASCNNVGDLLSELKDGAGAFESYRRGLAVAQTTASANPADSRAQRDLSVSHNRIGDWLWYANRFPEAMEHYRDSLQIRERLASGEPSSAIFRRDVMSSLNNIGETLARMGKRPEALESFRRGMIIARELAAADARNVQACRDLAVAHRNIGGLLLETGKKKDAARELREALRLFESLSTRDPASAVFKRDVAEARALLNAK